MVSTILEWCALLVADDPARATGSQAKAGAN
jgi:hypothetical protein